MRIALALLLVLTACRGNQPRPDVEEEPSAVHFIEDDFPRALQLARERGVPLFVDAWAPWCHTCLSMHANVFPDPALAPHADSYVWLSIDTEKPQNAAFVKRYPQQVWPTLFVIEPRKGHAVLRWLGSASTQQLIELLEDGERAARGGAEGADARLARADRLYANGQEEAAAALLQELLDTAPPDWPRRGRAVASLLFARRFGSSPDYEACTALALEELQTLPRSADWGTVASLGLSCSTKLPAGAPSRPPLEKRAREALADPAVELSVDDRSDLYRMLALSRRLEGDEAEAKAVAAEWLAFLEEQALSAPTPQARAVYDDHRLGAARLLGQPERAIEPLLLSEQQFPDDYNPPARLARAYLDLGRLDDALAANGRALEKVYGPRKVGVLNDRAAILRARGEFERARATYEEALTYAESLPPPQRPRHYVEQARAGLADLSD